MAIKIDPGPSEDDLKAQREAAYARFAELGAERVKHLLATDGFPHGAGWQDAANEWLKGKTDGTK